MLTEYIEEALRRARYEMIVDDEPFYGEVRELRGVWATGKTLEECRAKLKDVIEGWILISARKGLSIPKLGRARIQDIDQLTIPNPHRPAVGVDLLKRLLRQAGISQKDWLSEK